MAKVATKSSSFMNSQRGAAIHMWDSTVASSHISEEGPVATTILQMRNLKSRASEVLPKATWP